MDLGCTLKLLDDKDISAPTRTSEIVISGVEGAWKGTWTRTSNSADSRVDVRASSGVWFVFKGKDDEYSSLIVGRQSDQVVLLTLYGVGKDSLRSVGCGNTFAGTGFHEGPPTSDLFFNLWFSCS